MILAISPARSISLLSMIFFRKAAPTPDQVRGRLFRDHALSITIKQFDRNAFRAAQEGNPYSRAHRGRLPGELGAFRLKLGNHHIDAADREPEMIEALIGCGRRRIDAIS